MADMRRDHEREMEGCIDSVRQLSQELKLNMLIIDTFIPEQFQVGLFATLCRSVYYFLLAYLLLFVGLR